MNNACLRSNSLSRGTLFYLTTHTTLQSNRHAWWQAGNLWPMFRFAVRSVHCSWYEVYTDMWQGGSWKYFPWLRRHPSHLKTKFFLTNRSSAFWNWRHYHLILRGRDSAVSIATRYGLEGSAIESLWEWGFPHPSRPALAPTQPPIQRVQGLSQR